MCYNTKRLLVKMTYPCGEVKHVAVDDDGALIYFNVIEVPCGNCLECLERYSSEWAHRVLDEMSCHSDNCFITLTYDDGHNALSLDRRDIQLFLKSLRKKLDPQKIRYFYCGEYGSKGKRRHFHIMIFGWRPDDLKFFKRTKKGSILYLSQTVSDLWKRGFISVGDINPYTAKYSAKYLQKLQEVPEGFVKPFTGMSTKPGIGFLKINPKSLLTDKVYHGGQYIKVPRYYMSKLVDIAPDLVDEVLINRGERAVKLSRSKESLEKAREKCENLLTNKLNLL